MSETETYIADMPPNDGRQWEPMCARCGSSVSFERCDLCDYGLDGHDCGEDSCCCLYPEDNVTCNVCEGRGGWQVCMSTEDFCEGSPLPGREDMPRGKVEWYLVEPAERRA